MSPHGSYQSEHLVAILTLGKIFNFSVMKTLYCELGAIVITVP